MPVGHHGTMTDPLPFDVAAELDAKQAELRARIDRLTAPVEGGATIGFGKRIGDGTIQAIQQFTDAGSAQVLADTLDQVERARAKLAAGTWGRCDVCDIAIDPDRLEFRPWSTTCVEHAR